MNVNLNELLLEFLSEEGYRPHVDDDGDITFRCEGMSYLCLHDDGDELFFRIVLPAIYDVDDNNRARVLEGVDTVCRERKVIKAFTVGNKVWLSFEILADTTPVMADIVPRAISMLSQGRLAFYEAIGEN